jgi:hypothetical protein
MFNDSPTLAEPQISMSQVHSTEDARSKQTSIVSARAQQPELAFVGGWP